MYTLQCALEPHCKLAQLRPFKDSDLIAAPTFVLDGDGLRRMSWASLVVLPRHQTTQACCVCTITAALIPAVCMQVVLVPDIIFIVFLAINARRSHDILTRNPSTIMWTYYCLVWALSLCTFAHTCLQMAGTVRDGSEHLHLWNVLWLINRFVMVMLEVCAGHAYLQKPTTPIWSRALSNLFSVWSHLPLTSVEA